MKGRNERNVSGCCYSNNMQAERNMVNDLVNQGKNVEIIPQNTQAKTFDFIIDGVLTELKTIQNPNS